MSDHQTAINSRKVDHFNNSRNYTPYEYAYTILPFVQDDILIRVFNEVLIGIRRESELDELIEVFKIVFDKRAIINYTAYYSSYISTNQSPKSVLEEARYRARIALIQITDQMYGLSYKSEAVNKFREDLQNFINLEC